VAFTIIRIYLLF